MLYLRKYAPELWDEKCELDAVSISDLKTNGNDISVWQVANDESNIGDIALAIALTRDRIQDFYAVVLKDEDIFTKELQMNPLPGETKYENLRNEHNNIKVPTFWEIGYLAEYMHKQMSNDDNVKYFTERFLKEQLYQAVKNNKISQEDIRDKKEYKKIKQALEEMESLYGKI